MENLSLVVGVGGLFACFLLERCKRLRRTAASIEDRWLTNAGLLLIAGGASAVVFSAGSSVEIAQGLSGGIIRDLRLPLALEVLVLLLFGDFWRYWEHRLLHELSLLWRIHRVHHSDTAIDFTTSQRHHPLESLLVSFLWLIPLFAFGFSAEALAIYLVLSSLSAVLTHANINLPEGLDRPLRAVLVTPAVHAVHHSAHQPETDSNYGSILTIWDRIFGTYTVPSQLPGRFGLEYFRDAQDALLLSALLQPFRSRAASHPVAQSSPNLDAAATELRKLSPAWALALRSLALGACVVTLAMWPAANHLGSLWSHTIAYQYAWLVVPVFAYLAGWHYRETLLAMTPQASYAGVPLLVAAIALYVPAYSADLMLGQHLALVLALQGVLLCSLGLRIYLAWLPLAMLLWLLVPCGDVMQPLLRDLTLKWLSGFAIVAGLPHSIQGYQISIAGQDYAVLRECSGLSLFTLAGFLGYSLGLLLFRSFPKVLAMAVAGAALGILTNALRVCAIVTIDWVRGTQMDLEAHKEIELVVLLLLLSGLLYLAAQLRHQNEAVSPQPDGSTLRASVV